MTVAALGKFFRPLRGQSPKSGHILATIRMLRDSWSKMAALFAEAAKKKSLQGAATLPTY